MKMKPIERHKLQHARLKYLDEIAIIEGVLKGQTISEIAQSLCWSKTAVSQALSKIRKTAGDKNAETDSSKEAVQPIDAGYPENLYVEIFMIPEPVMPPDAEATIDELLKKLPERTAKSIKLYYQEDFTLEEIGKHFGIGKERVRQILARGLSKLRHPSRSQRLKYGLNADILISTEAQRRINEYEEQKLLYIDKMATKETGLSTNPIQQAINAVDKMRDPHSVLLATEIEKLDFSVRTYNCLYRHGFRTVKDVYENRKSLFEVRNFGIKTYEEIDSKFKNLGLNLKGDN